MKNILLFILAVGLTVGSGCSDNEKTTETKPAPPTPSKILAKLLTSKGEITCELEFEKTPITVANFVGLAEGTVINDEREVGVPYYDGLTFHKVVPDLMVLSGCPKGTGTGSPGYRFPDEIDESLTHNGPGILSMANAGGPDTNGSQFFITKKEAPTFDGRHTVFGHVVEGQDVVNSIEKDDILEKVTIVRIGEKADAFRSDPEAIKALLESHANALREKKINAAIAQREKVHALFPDAEKTASGLLYVITKEGTGAQPKEGANVSVYYTGKLVDGTIWSSRNDKNEPPLQFLLGEGGATQGWDEGISLMKQGEKRTLIMPPSLGYGSRRLGPIPPHSWLIFDVELVDAGEKE